MLRTRTRQYVALSVLTNDAVSVITPAGTAMSFSPNLLADAPVTIPVCSTVAHSHTCV